MNRKLEIDYSFGYVFDKSKLIVMYPVGTNLINEDDYEMEVEVAFLEDGIEKAFEESDINEANEVMRPLQNFLTKPSKIIPFITSIKDSKTKSELHKLLKKFDEEYKVKDSYIKKGYEIKDVYHVFENVASYIPKENLETLNILKVESDKFDMEKFIETTRENLDEAMDSNLIPVKMTKSTLTNRLFVKKDNIEANGIYVVFAIDTNTNKILCANNEILESIEIDTGDLEISNTMDAGFIIEEIDGYLTFKIASFNSETVDNHQIAQIVDYGGVLKQMMIDFINKFVK